MQIARIEEERHKVREKELGKNYLLETYLNGLHEAEDRDVTTGTVFIVIHNTFRKNIKFLQKVSLEKLETEFLRKFK